VIDRQQEIIRLIGLLDLTSLNDNDDALVIQNLCQQAQTRLGNVAAVCLYGQFVSTAKKALQNSKIPVATVANFPSGEASLDQIIVEVDKELAAGADEIDLVIPYRSCQAGEFDKAIEMVKLCKKQCGNKLLKVIIETGAFTNQDNLYQLALSLLNAGADFLKTSTGKMVVGATPEAAETLLLAIADFHQKTKLWRGFKVSGGVREVQQALDYVNLAKRICGEHYIQPALLRIGASSLLNNILNIVNV